MDKKKIRCLFCGKMHYADALFCSITGKQIPHAASAKIKPMPTISMKGEESPTQPISPLTPSNLKSVLSLPSHATSSTAEDAGQSAGDRCPLCGGFHKKGARFCNVTGEKIFRKRCPSCGQEVILRKPDAKYCPLCGGGMGPFCPYKECKAPLSVNLPFCTKCGRKLRYCSFCESPNEIDQEKCTSCETLLPGIEGEWPTFKGNPGRTGLSPQHLDFPLFIKWSYPDKCGDQVFTSSPILWRGTLYIGDNEGNLSVLNQYSGKLKWTRPTKGSILSSPAIEGGSLFLANTEGKVFALDADNGRILWVFPRKREEMSAPVRASILAGRGKVFVATHLAQAGEILALEQATGNLKWKFSENEVSGMSAGIQVSPALSNDTLIVATCAGFVYALNADSGKMLWKFPRDNPLKAGICATPVVSDGLVYIGDRSGKLFALKVDSGEDTWHFSTEIEGSINSSPSVGTKYIYVGTWAEYLYCLDKTAGGMRWRYRNEKISVFDAINQAPLILDDTVVICVSNSGYIYALDTMGCEIWKYRLESEIISTPVVSDGFLYVVTASGLLYAFYPRNPQRG